jgi:hypothetical protein
VSTFELETTHTITVREGWGVDVMAIWAGADEPIHSSETEVDDTYSEIQMDEPTYISEIQVAVVHITPAACKLVGGVWCVDTGDGSSWVPVENFRELEDLPQDDTHDLRTRWFATEREAIEHADTVKARWAHPAPWESFVELG